MICWCGAVLDAHPEQSLSYFPHRAELVDLVPAYARPGDVILTLGGGDITTLGDELLARRRHGMSDPAKDSHRW